MRVDPHKYGESVLLAISGGADSIVMGELFVRDNIDGVTLAVAHCNFNLRGGESDGDEAFVRAWAAKHGLEVFVRHFDTAAFASGNGVSIEMAARELRYRWFDSLCAEKGFDGVCVAHNANDNAETLMLNLLRGTGMKGLCAMGEAVVNPYGTSMVFRPMLGYSRQEIEDYAAQHRTAFRTDSTNLQTEYKRNKLRNGVFPIFASINPSFIGTFADNISHFREAEAIVREYASKFDFKPDGRLSIKDLKSDPHWRYLLYDILSRYGFSGTVSDEIAGLLSGSAVSGRRFESPGYVLVTTTSELVLQSKDSMVSEETYRTAPSFGVEMVDWKPGMSPRAERGVILVDADKLDGEPRFRRWQAGDWLNPIGLKGRKKVSDMLTDLKYNILEKENVYVLEGSGNHVLAVVGERIDASVRITPDTTRVWKITSSIAGNEQHP